MSERIAFIGAGRMGGRMATRLLEAGYDVAVYDPSADAAAPFGERATRSPAEAAAGAAFILFSVPNPAILREAVAGALEGAASGALIIDLSTGDPESARELAAAAAERGVGFLDAPVSRGIAGAESGTLLIMAGGAPEALDRARPVLAHLASDVVHAGDVGAGQAVKLCNQMLTAIVATGLGEVLVTGVRAGVELGTLTRVLAGGSAGNWVLDTHLPRTLLTADRETSFSLALMRKDVGLFVDAADGELPLSELVRTRFDAAHDAGLDGADYTSVAELYERPAGVRLGC